MNNASDIWNSVLRVMREELKMSQTTLNTWFDDIEAAEFSDNSLLLLTTAEFKKGIILQNYSEMIKNALFELFSVPIEFKLLTKDEYEDGKNPSMKVTPIDYEYSFEHLPQIKGRYN